MAKDFLMGFVHEKSLPLVKLKTSLFVFKDGKYVYNTSSGGTGLCQDTNAVGQFKGTLKKEELKEMNSLLDNIESECTKAKDCIKGFDDNDREKFALLDYRKKNQNFTFAEDKGSKLIEYIENKIPKLRTNPARSLKILKMNKEIKLIYKGSEKYQTSLGIENFIVLKKDGAFVKLKNYSNEDHAHARVASFNQTEQTHTFKPKIDWKRLQAEGNYLIYSNKVDAHHNDKLMKIYTPCTKL